MCKLCACTADSKTEKDIEEGENEIVSLASNVITEDEFYQFSKLPLQKKIKSMEAYLIGVNGRKFNMKQVGAMVFGDENFSFTVSLIHRCYNFSNQNSGRYAPGCKFEKTYGYRVTVDDIEAFVRTYPNGTFNTGITFEDFLKTRLINAAQGQNQPAPQWTAPSQYNVPEPGTNIAGNRDFGGQAPPKPFFIIGCIGILVLVILLLTGNLFRNWLFSLIVLIITIGAFRLPQLMQGSGSQGDQGGFGDNEHSDFSVSPGNTPFSRGTSRTPQKSGSFKAQKSGAGFNIGSLLKGKNLSGTLNLILLLVFVADGVISAEIRHQPVSTRFWALFIAVATTKAMIFDAKKVPFFGKALILGIVWLVAFSFI